MVFCWRCGTEIPGGAAFCPSCGAAAGATGGQVPMSGMSTVTKDPVAQEYWVSKLFAFLIDAAIVYAVIGLVVAAAALPGFIEGVLVPGSSPSGFPFGAFFGTFASLVLVLYLTVTEGTYGKTIGKGVMRLQVTTDAHPSLSLGQAFLRNLSKINWVLLFLDVVVGLPVDPGYTRKLSDRFLGTSVIRSA